MSTLNCSQQRLFASLSFSSSSLCKNKSLNLFFFACQCKSPKEFFTSVTWIMHITGLPQNLVYFIVRWRIRLTFPILTFFADFQMIKCFNIFIFKSLKNETYFKIFTHSVYYWVDASSGNFCIAFLRLPSDVGSF